MKREVLHWIGHVAALAIAGFVGWLHFNVEDLGRRVMRLEYAVFHVVTEGETKRAEPVPYLAPDSRAPSMANPGAQLPAPVAPILPRIPVP